MHYIQHLPTSFSSLAGLVPPITTEASPLDILIANVLREDGTPLVKRWIKPGNQFHGLVGTADYYIDVASGGRYRVNSEPVQGTEIGDKPTFTLDGLIAFEPTADITVAQNTMTYISVFKPTGEYVGNKFLFGPNTGSATTAGSPSLYMTPTGLSSRVGGPLSIIASGTDYQSEVPKVITLTMSAEGGTSIRRNGIEVVRDVTRTLPLTTSLVRLYGQPGTGARPTGESGPVLWFEGDLSSPAYLSQLKAIETALMQEYDITLGS